MPSPLPSPSLDSILYFFSNSLAILGSAAVLFFALGVIYGWLSWAKYKRRARAYQEETDLLRHEIARLKRHIALASVAPDAANEESGASSPLVTQLEITGILEQTAPPPVLADISLPALLPVETPAPKPETAPAPIVPPRPKKELRPDSLAAAVLRGIKSKAATTEPSTFSTPEDMALITLPEPRAAAAEKPPATADLTRSAAERAFATDLASGAVTLDPDFGILHPTRPERVDDLTLLRGVAETVQNKLHDLGIYTFKQIATWSPENLNHINQRLLLRGRPQRDRWPQQARDLHYLTHGEKVG